MYLSKFISLSMSLYTAVLVAFCLESRCTLRDYTVVSSRSVTPIAARGRFRKERMPRLSLRARWRPRYDVYTGYTRLRRNASRALPLLYDCVRVIRTAFCVRGVWSGCRLDVVLRLVLFRRYCIHVVKDKVMQASPDLLGALSFVGIAGVPAVSSDLCSGPFRARF